MGGCYILFRLALCLSGSNNLCFLYIASVLVKASSGPRYVVGCRSKIPREKLTSGTRVVLDITTLTIMRPLPREVIVIPLPLFEIQFHI